MIGIIEVLDTVGGKILIFTGIILITFVVDKIIRRAIHSSLAKHSHFDPTRFALLKHFTSFFIYIVGFGFAVYSIPELRTLSISLFAGAGVLAIVIGFASQKAFGNIVSGIFIAIFKPFRVGDRIAFSDKLGIVEDITLRHTIIRNFENKRIIIPNSIISDETIINYNIGDERICRFVDFSISYDSDVDKAMKIIQDESKNHPLFFDTRTKKEKEKKVPPIVVRVIGFGDSSVNLRAWVWTKSPGDAFVLGTDLNKTIKRRFDKEGIELPFPYRTIVTKKSKRHKSCRR